MGTHRTLDIGPNDSAARTAAGNRYKADSMLGG
jgi:hypothetical protein